MRAMERVQEVQQSGDGAQVQSLSPFPEAELAAPDLEQLALAARAAPGPAALGSLHEALSELQPNERNAKELLRLLDADAFHPLGTATRELALESLLRLGYPWALQIHPDELAWLRGAHLIRRRNKLLVLLGVFALGAVGQALLMQLF